MDNHIKIKNAQGETLKAGCVVTDERGRVLLVNDRINAIWTFPKGHLEAGEELSETAIRELKEETGYDVQILKRLTDATYCHPQTGEAIRVALFRAAALATGGLGEAETISRWFSVEEARKLLPSNLLAVLNEALLV